MDVSQSYILEHFGELFLAAMRDPRTTRIMKQMFEPLVQEETRKVQRDIKELKDVIETQTKRVDYLEESMEKMRDRTIKAEKHQEQLEHDNAKLTETVCSHQRYLESLDYDRRSNNLIITGMAESEDRTDKHRVQEVLLTIQKQDTDIISIGVY